MIIGGRSAMETITRLLLKAELEYKRNLTGYNKREMAEKLGMNKNTFCRKCNNPYLFTLEELIQLRDALGVESIDNIFNIKHWKFRPINKKEENDGEH
jgi:DNA-binding XRE family transcriptional regulator